MRKKLPPLENRPYTTQEFLRLRGYESRGQISVSYFCFKKKRFVTKNTLIERTPERVIGRLPEGWAATKVLQINNWKARAATGITTSIFTTTWVGPKDHIEKIARLEAQRLQAEQKLTKLLGEILKDSDDCAETIFSPPRTRTDPHRGQVVIP